MKTVTVRVKEFSQMVETYLARGGVKGFINAELTEGKQVLPLKEVRTFIDTYNRHFLTNYRAEEFIIRDRLTEKKASYIEVRLDSPMAAKRMMAWLDKNISPVNNQLYDGAYREGQSIIQFEDVPNVDALDAKTQDVWTRILTLDLHRSKGIIMKYGQSFREAYRQVRLKKEDNEVSMAVGQLKTMQDNLNQLMSILQSKGSDYELEAWVQSKITSANDKMTSAADYMKNSPSVSEAF